MGIFGFGKKKQVPDREPMKSDEKTYSLNAGGITIEIPNPNLDSPVPSHHSSWIENVDTFLGRNKNAKPIKLLGKPEDLAEYPVGGRCNIAEDFDHDGRFNVLFDDSVIGYLPSSAISYAENNDISPEDLAVIIFDSDYDINKERDIISVYISD